MKVICAILNWFRMALIDIPLSKAEKRLVHILWWSNMYCSIHHIELVQNGPNRYSSNESWKEINSYALVKQYALFYTSYSMLLSFRTINKSIRHIYTYTLKITSKVNNNEDYTFQSSRPFWLMFFNWLLRSFSLGGSWRSSSRLQSQTLKYS